MKIRPTPIARTAARRRRFFAFHPLSFAICLGLSGAALALPQGGKVVAGEATISKPTPTTQVINQSTDKAIIDWKSFSIAAGEKVRFYQPSNSSVTLNRVTGYDPSFILGEMSSNGKIFLVNPYGVVFGAGARVDVGGIVVSTLSIANNDFLAGRYSLTSVDPAAPAQRGEVRNEGTISAPGGTVVLAGPSVTNTGTIIANGGRVGLVAANAVSVDVEGDGLLFFQTSATEAKNRLDQLGRIQADGGTVEMRAAARGAFADTVLNMTGIVQAKTVGTRAGRVVIDGGGEGIVAVSGQIDATGLAAGQRGGDVVVQGQRVLIDNGANLDASGSAGGGSVRIGGDLHGANPEVRNAEYTGVAETAQIHADAIDSGDGGKVVVWADQVTRYYGTISAKGGSQGGNGGFVEVSGKDTLIFRGDVSTLAPKGKAGTLLLDPTDIVIADANASADDTQLDAGVPVGGLIGAISSGDAPAAMTISSTKLEAIAGANNISLQATNSITINDLVTNVAVTKTLTLNTAGSATFSAGAGGFNMATDNKINVTNGSLSITTPFGPGPVSVGSLQATGGVTLNGTAITTNGTITAGTGVTLTGTSVALNGAIAVTTAGAGVSVTGPVTLGAGGGTITLTGSNAGNDVTLGTVNGARPLVITAAGGDIVLGTVGPTVTGVTLTANTASLQGVTTTGAQNYSAVTTTTLNGALNVSTAGAGVSAGAVTLAAGGGTIGLTGSNAANDVTLGAVNGGSTLAITAGGGDVTLGTVGAVTPLTGVSINAATAAIGNVTTDGNQTYNAAVSAAAITLDAGTGAISATNAGNDFTGAVTLNSSGADVSIRDTNALTLATPTLGANTGLTAIAGTTLTLPAGAISTGTGSIDLRANGGALTTPGALTTTSGSITLVGSTGLTVANDLTTTSGTIALTGGGAGGLTVNNARTVDAGNNTITADGGGGAIDLNNSTLTTTSNSVSAITVRNATTVSLGNLATGATGTTTLGVGADISGAIIQTPSTAIDTGTLTASSAPSRAAGPSP
jgi:trimeric autotransporter adhesin